MPKDTQSVLELARSKPRPDCEPSLAFMSHYLKGFYEQQNQIVREMSVVFPLMNKATILQQRWASRLLHMLVPLPGKPFPWENSYSEAGSGITSSRMPSLTPLLCSCAILFHALLGTVWNDSAHLSTPTDKLL